MAGRYQAEASTVLPWAIAIAQQARQQNEPALRLGLEMLSDALRWLTAVLAGEEDADEPDMPGRLLVACDEVISALNDCRAAVRPAAVHDIETLLRALEPALRPLRTVALPHRGGGSSPATPPGADAGLALLDLASDLATPLPARATLGATAPKAVAPGASFVARFVVCSEHDRDRLARQLAQDPGSHERVLRFDLNRPQLPALTHVRLRLGRGLAADEGESLVRPLHWTGELQSLDFDLLADAAPGAPTTQLAFHVEAAGLSIGRVSLDLQFGPGPAGVTHGSGSTARRAFASYSSRDRDRVLDRVAALRIGADMDVFIDCMDLAPGKAWMPRLSQEIAERDLFMLFWSAEAQKSRWVKWEYEQALALSRPPEAMQVHPLENDVRAPRALRHLHFSDPVNALRRSSRRIDST